ncbi:MAG: hypothetical protein ABI334_10960 [Candidatus Dormiibacterota bacterium]
MNPFAAVAVKAVGAAGAAAILSLGLAGGLAQAASPSPKPTPTAGTTQGVPDPRSDRRAIRLAVVESEADVLGITPKALLQDLRKGRKVSDLAKDKGMTEKQFEANLVADLKPRLEVPVGKLVITQVRTDKVLDRISKGHVPFWDGIHHRTSTTK